MIKRENLKNICELTPLQEAILFHSLEKNLYSVQYSFTIQNSIDVSIFKESFEILLNRYDILKTLFIYENVPKPLQFILKKAELNFTYEESTQSEIGKFKIEDRERGFNLSKELPFRVTLLKNENNFEFIFTIHHIILDGWGLANLLKEFLEIYNSLKNSSTLHLNIPKQFCEYVSWLKTIDEDENKNYWSDYLSGFEEASKLPKKTSEKFILKENTLTLQDEKFQKFKEVAINQKVTLNSLVQTLWAIILSKYTNSNDVIFGNTISGRNIEFENIEEMIGLFINTIPTRVKLKNTLFETLHSTKEDTLNQLPYQNYPLYKIQNLIKKPLFEHIVVFENYPIDEKLFQNENFNIQNLEIYETNNYDLSLIVLADEDKIDFTFSYNGDAFEDRFIETLKDSLKILINLTIKKIDLKISEIDILPNREKELLASFNNTETTFPTKNIVEIFEERVKENLNKIALVFEEKSLTYGELNIKVNILANYLIDEKHIHNGDFIAIMMDRSEYLIITILAILKVGGIYVPIDKNLPKERIEYILNDCEAKVILSDFDNNSYINVKNIKSNKIENSNINIKLNDLAYLIYTSGTTGKPKGVMVEHISFLNQLLWRQKEYQLSESDTILQKTPYSFDVSIWEIFWWILADAKISLIKPNGHKSPQEIIDVIEKNNITVIHFVASMLNIFLNYLKDNPKEIKRILSIKKIFTSGEAVNISSVKLLDSISKEIELHNLYGPTEGSIEVTYFNCREFNSRYNSIPIGKPISNLNIYILNSDLQEIPIGMEGELYIGGIGVARGYLKQDELTKEKFITHPKFGRIYKSGDLAKWNYDGNIEYIGRIDEQIKIRGFRIELGEIEANLKEHSQVKEATLKLKDGQILAYYVADGELNDLKEFLANKLPEYMIPNSFMKIKSIPLTPNGKVDRKALPDIEIKSEYIVPTNELEKKLISIFNEILGVETISIVDNFFEMGGDSLKVITLLSKISKELKVKVYVQEVFKYPTIQSLAKLIKSKNTTKFIEIPKVKDSHSYEVSSGQKRLWLIDKLHGDNLYNILGVFKLDGKVNLKALNEAFRLLVNRHEILRTSFIEENSEVRQIINEFDLNIEVVDSGINEIIEIEKQRVFDLTKLPLLKVIVVKYDFLIINMHHIISDWFSSSIIMKEIKEIYNSFLNKEEPKLSKLSIQYKDYSAWENRLEIDSDYFKSKFKNLPPRVELADYSRGSKFTHEGKTLYFEFDREITIKSKEFIKSNNVTMFIFLNTLLKVLLYKYSNEKDITIGAIVSNRVHENLQNQIGFYANTLPLRDELNPNATFLNTLNEIKSNTLEAFNYQSYQFDKLLEDLNINYAQNQNPLFDVMLILENENLEFDLKELKVKEFPIDLKVAKLDLTFSFKEIDNKLNLSIEYNTNLFSEKKIQNFAKHFEELLSRVIKNPTKKLSEIEILTMDERRVLTSFNDTDSEYKQKSIIEVFEEVVKKYPNEVAVICEDRTLTYSELNERANEIANYLIENFEIKSDDLIAFMLDRSEKLVISIFAILKSGGAYVPIDKKYPKDRVEYIINNSKPKVILNDEDGDIGVNISSITHQNKQNPNIKISPNNLAYVIYTSGTTGEPKGVMIEHKSVVALANNLATIFGMKQRERIYTVTSITFDMCILEFLSAPITNIPIVIGTNLHDPFEIRDDIKRAKPSIMQMTPSRLNMLIEAIGVEGLKPLNKLLIGGEAFDTKLFEKLKEFEGEVFNVYGPTETTTWSMFKSLKDGVLNLGKPLLDELIYLLDRDLLEVPNGVIGEIYIGGLGVARGYLNKQVLTNEKFITHPKFGRIYKSGDLAKRNYDGDIEYIGRSDEQVKVRGFRIELGEVETTLREHSKVKDAVTKVKDGELLAYYIADEELNDLKEFLIQKLPEYMIPSNYMKIDFIPLSQNDKIDRKALPDIEINSEYFAPTNEIEERLESIWCEILKKEKISIKDNFFSIGGNSLKLMSLLSKIFKEFNIKVTFEEMFKYNTIKSLANILKSKDKTTFINIPKLQESSSYEVSSGQKRLWLIDKLEDGTNLYNILGAFKLNGEVNLKALNEAFRVLVNRHEILRTSFEEIDGEVRQVINEIDFNIEVINGEPKEIIEAENRRVFDLTKAPLFNVKLILNILTVNIHHIISDGFSLNIMIKEVSKIYEDILEDKEIDLKPLSIQYKDYSVWEQKQEFDISFFREKFKTEPTHLELSEFSRPANLTYQGSSFEYIFNNLASLKSFTKEYEITLFMLLTTVLKTLIYKYTNEKDITIGTILANREHIDLENQIGFYANTLPLRDNINPNSSFLEFLKEIKKNVLKTFEFQNYSFDRLLDDLSIKREANHSPLFDILIILQNEEEKFKLKELEISEIFVTPEVAKFDLTFNFMEVDGVLKLLIDYNSNLFNESKVASFAKHFEKILNTIVATPTKKLSEIEILLEDEKEIIKQQKIPSIKSDIVREFEKIAHKYPNREALKYKNRSYSYKELNERANEIANYLKEKYKIYNDDFIAIMTKKSHFSIIGLLAIMKSGGVYLPIDEEYPKERIDFIIKDTKPKVILSEGELLNNFEFAEDITKITHSNKKSPINTLTYNSLAYIIYTSGSTGKPKGVMVEHGGFINMITSQIKIFDVKEDDRIIQFASLSFDASLSEIFMTLLSGATLIVSDKELSGFDKFLKDENITIATFPPSFLNTLGSLPTLKSIITAGEAPIVEDIKRFSDKNYFNAYGPTENSVCATISKVEDTNKISIGKPIAGVQIYILDESFKLVPIGAIGEIFIAGNSLARGYLNRSDENIKRFISLNGERVYRTGDLGRWLSNGSIEFLGRGDEQVKVRGIRIELGEVISTILKNPKVENVAVFKDSDKLLAYYVGEEVDLRDYLNQLLPHYMIPNSFMRVDSIPLTTNGKVDKKALLSLEFKHEYIAPTNEIEELLVKVWSSVLGGEIGVNDNFFEVGGDSIKAIQISSRLLNEGYKCESKAIFESKTIKALAPRVAKSEEEISQEAIVGEVALSPIQNWFFENFGMLEQFNQSILLETKDLNENILKIVFEALVKHHDILRASYYEDERVIQEIKGIGEVDFYSIDLRSAKNPPAMLDFYTERVNGSLNLKNRLFKIVLFKLVDREILFIAMHHLIIDGISWRILIEDLKNSYLEYAKTQTINLPLKTHSYRDYVERVTEYSQSEELAKEVSYWQNLKVQKEITKELNLKDGVEENVFMSLSLSESEALLKEVNRAFNTEINDILLTALIRAIHKWQRLSEVAINLEGHGREESLLKLNLSKTIGWFTTIYPVVLSYSDKGLHYQIKEIKENLRNIPNRGFCYNVLKYVNKLEFDLVPQISFNYLGEFREFENELFSLAEESVKGEVSSEAKRVNLLDFIALIENGSFTLSIKYLNSEFSRESMQSLIEAYRNELLEIISYCKHRDSELTPSDIDDEDFDIESLSEFLDEFKEEFDG